MMHCISHMQPAYCRSKSGNQEGYTLCAGPLLRMARLERMSNALACVSGLADDSNLCGSMSCVKVCRRKGCMCIQ